MKHSCTSGVSRVSVSVKPKPPGQVSGFEADLQLIYTMYTKVIPISLHCERRDCKTVDMYFWASLQNDSLS